MMQQSRAPRSRRFVRIILQRLRTVFQFIQSERFARALTVAVDFALAVYQTAVTAA
mgnify:CR=1 FL=1